MTPRPPHIRLLSLALLLALTSTGWTFRNVSPGMEAPEVELTAFDGSSVSLEAIYDQGPVALLFWASWSERSLRELEDLVAMQAQPEYAGLQILAINVESEHLTPDERFAITEAVGSSLSPSRLLWDEGLQTFHEYGVISVPSSLLINAQGSITMTLNGYSPAGRERLADGLRSLFGLQVATVEVAHADGIYRPDRDASLHHQLGRKLLRSGFPERAVDEFAHALGLDSGFVQNRIDLAEALWEMGDLEAASQHLVGAIELNPDNPVSHHRYALCLLAEENRELAAEHLEAALEGDPEYDPARLELAVLRAEQGQVEVARRLLEDVAGLSPRDPKVLAAKAEVALAEQKVDLAVSLYRQAVEQLLRAERQ